MKKAERGFSLIEAMVSLLVLSIGLLGLGQLQTRLWRTSGELHSMAEAYLLGASELEKSLAVLGTGTTPSGNGFTRTSSSGTVYQAQLALAANGQLVDAEIRVGWNDRGGQQAIRLQTAAVTDLYEADTRWLLPRF
jgi:prepilin-type N-terminal cleavage/methylation domain-containing protein